MRANANIYSKIRWIVINNKFGVNHHFDCHSVVAMALRGLKRGEKRGLEELHRAATTKEEINNSGNGGESGGVADSLSAVEALPKDEVR